MNRSSKKQALNLKRKVSVATILIAGLLLLVILGVFTVFELNSTKQSSDPSATIEQGAVPIKVRITQDLSDLPENLRAPAKEAEAYITTAVGQKIYDDYYRIALDNTIDCSQSSSDSRACIVFLYLPPSQYGLSDFFLTFKYNDEGKLVPTGKSAYCLKRSTACLFKISQQEAYDIIKAKGNDIDIKKLKLYYSNESYWAVPHWEWKTYIPLSNDDSQCSTSRHFEVDVVTGLYTTGERQSCM